MRPSALITESGLLDEASIALLHQVGTVVIVLGQRQAGALPTLTLDDSMLGQVAIQHLIERGCRTLAMVMPLHPRARVRARNRLVGARRAVRANKNVRVHISLVDMADSDRDSARVVAAWRTTATLPEGVYGFDDQHSGYLLGALCDAGVRVPGQLALVGADDQPLCDMLRPKLTSVAQDLDSMREAFAEPVLAAIRGNWTTGTRGEPWGAVLVRRET
jgi:DNA-binding LacI/PurR family transcriptional regulator